MYVLSVTICVLCQVCILVSKLEGGLVIVSLPTSPLCVFVFLLTRPLAPDPSCPLTGVGHRSWSFSVGSSLP